MAELKNPTGKKSSFLYDSREYFVNPGESKPFPPEIIRHYCLHVHGPLKIIEEEEIIIKESKEEIEDVENLKWKELIQLGKKLGVYEFGMGKEELIGEIRNAGNSN